MANRIYIWNLIFLIFLFYSCSTSKNIESKPENISIEKELITTDIFLSAKKALYKGNQKQAVYYFEKCIKINKNHDPSYFELARIYEFQNQKKAIDYIENAIKIAPKNVWYKELLMRIYDSQKKYENAIQINKQLIELEPENKNYYYQLANFYISNSNYSQAANTYSKIIEQFGYEENILLQQKQIYLNLNDYKKAINVTKTLIEHNPENKDYYGMIAEMYLQINKEDEAMSAYNKILQLDPNDGFVHLALADYYKSKGEKENSINQLKIAMSSKTLASKSKIEVLLSILDLSHKDSSLANLFTELLDLSYIAQPNDPKILALKADFASQKGKYKEAITFFRTAIAVDSTKFILWNQLLFVEEKDSAFNDLKHDSQKALTLFPQEAASYYYNGLAYAQEGNWARVREAMQVGKNFISSKENTALFLALQAKAEMELGETSESILNFKKAISLDPENYNIKKDFAISLASHEIDIETALHFAKQAFETDKENPDFIYSYSYCLFKQNKKDEARDLINEALKKYPENVNLKFLNTELNKTK